MILATLSVVGSDEARPVSLRLAAAATGSGWEDSFIVCQIAHIGYLGRWAAGFDGGSRVLSLPARWGSVGCRTENADVVIKDTPKVNHWVGWQTRLTKSWATLSAGIFHSSG